MIDRRLDWVTYHASITPMSEALASIESGESWTWLDLDDRVGRLAAVLRSAFHVSPGDRVALIAENDPRIFEVQFACMRIGAILVPLNWRLTVAELGDQVGDCDSHVIVCDDTWLETASEIATLVPEVQILGIKCADIRDYEQALRECDTPIAGTYLNPATPTHILYSSGTTGKPKGVVCTNETLASQAQSLAHTSQLAMTPCHHLNVLPLFHAGGLNVLTNPVLFWGGKVTTYRRFDESSVLQSLTSQSLGITHFAGVLQMLERIVRMKEFDQAHFPHLRVVQMGGWGPTTREIYQRFQKQGVQVYLGYGGSEMGPNVTVLGPGNDVQALAGSSGIPLPHLQVRIVDPAGSDAAPGDVGEIWVAGGSVTPGYWNKPRSESFEGDWFRTGDLGHLAENGHLFVDGRVKEMYRSGGENIYPAEVENALVGMPGVIDLAAVGVPDEQWGEVGLLVVTLAEGATVTLADVRSYARARLPRYKLPKHLMVVSEMPRSATEKISRVQLRAEFERRHAQS